MEDAWSLTPTYEEAALICASEVPYDQWNWIETNYRMFFTKSPEDPDSKVYLFTGDIEITLKEIVGDKTWECHGGKYTAAADASNGAIRYADKEIPAGSEVLNFGYFWAS